MFEKLNPAPVANIVPAPKLKCSTIASPSKDWQSCDANKATELPRELIPIQPPQDIQPPEFPNQDKIKFALWATLAVLVLTLLWYLIRYAQLQRFLKRHSALQPPDLTQFFLKNKQQNLYSSVAFARTAQQLHKHRDLDTQRSC